MDGYDNVYGACGVIGSYCPSVEAAAIFGAFEWYVLSRLPSLGNRASDVIVMARESFPVSSRYLKHQALRPSSQVPTAQGTLLIVPVS